VIWKPRLRFATEAGTVDRVTIRLLDDSDQARVELEYDILQLDSVVLAEFIQEAAFSTKQSTLDGEKTPCSKSRLPPD